MSQTEPQLFQSQSMQALSDLRVEVAALRGELKGELGLTNQKLEAVINSLKEGSKNRKWMVTTALSSITTAVTLIYFIVRFG